MADEIAKTLAELEIGENGNPSPPENVNPLVQVLSNGLLYGKIVNFCVLDMDTLKSLRLLCHQMHQDTLKIWREKSVLRLHDWDVESGNAPPGYVSPSTFLQLMNHPSGNVLGLANYPLQNIRLQGWNILQPDVDRSQEELWFWRNVGPTLKYLHLDNCTFTHHRFNGLMNMLPNLEWLKINGYGHLDWEESPVIRCVNQTVKTIEVVGSLPFLKWDFLKVFPKLEAIHLRNFSNNYLFKDLMEIRRESDFTTHALKTVDVINTSQVKQGLLETNFPLEHLTLRLNPEVEKGDFKRIFRKYGENLKTLQLFRFPIDHPAYAPFDRFPSRVQFRNLKALELWGNVISNFKFLKTTPLLETLKVDLQCFEKMKTIEYWRSRRDKMVIFHGRMVWDEEEGPFGVYDLEGIKLDQMHTLEVDYKFTNRSMEMLGTWMPNLRRLATVLDNETLQTACGQWPDLRELKVGFGSEVDDNGIVGNGGNMHCVESLKELKTFELAAHCGQSRLTEVAVQGLMNMNALDNLKICVSPQVSLECEEELLEMKENATLFRNYGDGPHFNEFNCCRISAFLQRNAAMPDN